MIGLVHSCAPLRNRKLERTGATIMEKMRAPRRAKATVHAIGRRAAFHRLQGENGQIGGDDHTDGKEDRALHLVCRLPDLLRRRSPFTAVVTEMADNVPP